MIFWENSCKYVYVIDLNQIWSQNDVLCLAYL